ncbi:MAG: isoprenylcysteine carboxylmethyltransferase family protein [Anaerolineales bacterium]|jgi:protein-S-isoprenylcysteine O-methyltransferase Ste14|nr:isoprenylcysteine carboxylmethyltransferase family protein [Anaerolineales bacterium]NTW11814.1 isoprenylcysteine carboxylmethyltransferase family protein [Anaerolineales bacterium]
MSLQHIASVIEWIGGIFAYSALALVLYGVWRGTQRKAGRTTGKTGHFLRSFWFYLASSALFFSIAYFGWVPLKWAIPQPVRFWMLVIGALLYFPGMAFTVWARLALGKNYFVSTGFGAQLFDDHQLVTSGPFAIVRHPMYAGLILASVGALLIYMTWTTISFALFAPLTLVRARREEQALAAEFGEQWQEYCKQVPLLIPHIRKRSHA